MQKTKCAKCGSTEIYYVQNVKHYWTVDENGDMNDTFETTYTGKPKQHCYICKN